MRSLSTTKPQRFLRQQEEGMISTKSNITKSANEVLDPLLEATGSLAQGTGSFVSRSVFSNLHSFQFFSKAVLRADKGIRFVTGQCALQGF